MGRNLPSAVLEPSYRLGAPTVRRAGRGAAFSCPEVCPNNSSLQVRGICANLERKMGDW